MFFIFGGNLLPNTHLYQILTLKFLSVLIQCRVGRGVWLVPFKIIKLGRNDVVLVFERMSLAYVLVPAWFSFVSHDFILFL